MVRRVDPFLTLTRDWLSLRACSLPHSQRAELLARDWHEQREQRACPESAQHQAERIRPGGALRGARVKEVPKHRRGDPDGEGRNDREAGLRHSKLPWRRLLGEDRQQGGDAGGGATDEEEAEPYGAGAEPRSDAESQAHQQQARDAVDDSRRRSDARENKSARERDARQAGGQRDDEVQRVQVPLPPAERYVSEFIKLPPPWTPKMKTNVLTQAHNSRRS
eukprot:CAMPEP_0196711578 /NCGR_PEP_ID=MMETSP1090-20130531/72663_1 /TAXON_ID=37098 /ORGANISM="Isochrysis sp, Strain CCMP1244" /LENGTH=220 /DNA_ID=CAMNT_0042051639 /DNA_START=131 /DNA_END=791 /DNA_ORIENTATION=-